MAFIQCNYWSEVPGKRCDMTVLLPRRRSRYLPTLLEFCRL